MGADLVRSGQTRYNTACEPKHTVTERKTAAMDRSQTARKEEMNFPLSIGDRIHEVKENKKQYLPLLLLADEQEDMIDRYLERGTLYVLRDGETVIAECVVTDEGDGVLEIKSLAVAPECQGRGYGRIMIRFVAEKYRDRYTTLQVGTGDSPLTVPFYERCGFVRHHINRNFFLENYDHPIFEGGQQLKDMIYLRMPLV